MRWLKPIIFGSMRTFDVSPGTIPLAGCKLKMNMPVATTGEIDSSSSNKFYIGLRISNGDSSRDITYGIDNVSYKPSWDVYTIWVHAGEIEINIEDGYRYINSLGWFDLGDINDWYVKGISMVYYLSDKNNYMSVAIDYIDFVCEE